MVFTMQHRTWYILSSPASCVSYTLNIEVNPYLTLPAVLRHGGHDGAQTGGVVHLVAVLAGDGARLAAGHGRVGRRRLAATHLAHATRPARPSRTYTYTITFIINLLAVHVNRVVYKLSTS